jgi:hypothetical protein
MFISILYMFRAAMCPSSGKLIVSVGIWYMSLCLMCRCKPAHEMLPPADSGRQRQTCVKPETEITV